MSILFVAITAVAVWALIRLDSPWLLLVWLVVITAYSGWLVLKRCQLAVGTFLPAVGAGLLVGVALCSLWLLALVLPVRVFDARWFVPVTALLTGHAAAMMIRGLNTYVSALKTDEQQYEFPLIVILVVD